MTKSVAYRNHHDEIWRAEPPPKYTRILPYVVGRNVLDLGCAEGVLSLMMAEPADRSVVGLDRHRERYDEALALQERWRELGKPVDRCRFVCADLRERLDLLEGLEVLVAMRSIYYFRDEVDAVFAEVGKRVPRVVLCGNANRAARYLKYKGHPPDKLGPFNFLASADGMRQVLTRAGYRISTTVTQGDPIVVGDRV